MKRDTFLTTRTKVLENAVSEVIDLRYNRQGSFACIQNISVTDLTTSPARIDIGFLRGNIFTPIRSFLAPAIGFTVIHDNETWLYIDDMPACRIITGVAGDQIQLVVTGYILYDYHSEE